MGFSDEIKSYGQIRRHTTPEAFVAAMAFVSWHNRLTFTSMLEPWQGLVVAMVCEERQIEGMQFQAIKTWFEQSIDPPPASDVECQQRATALGAHLTSAQ
ncbi:MAG: hypothetical protein WAU88_04705 [Candidatus Zixiibacteriota bacterium]